MKSDTRLLRGMMFAAALALAVEILNFVMPAAVAIAEAFVMVIATLMGTTFAVPLAVSNHFGPLSPVAVVVGGFLMFRAVAFSSGRAGSPVSFDSLLEAITGGEHVDDTDWVKSRAYVQQYIDGEITEAELEKRLEAAWEERKGMAEHGTVHDTDANAVYISPDDEDESSEGTGLTLRMKVPEGFEIEDDQDQ